MRPAPVWMCLYECAAFVCLPANSNKSGGLWITSSWDNYLSTSQFKVSFTNPFTCRQIHFDQSESEIKALLQISQYTRSFLIVSLMSFATILMLPCTVCDGLHYIIMYIFVEKHRRVPWFSYANRCSHMRYSCVRVCGCACVCSLSLLLRLVALASEWGLMFGAYLIGSARACVSACVCSVFSSVPRLKPLILG